MSRRVADPEPHGLLVVDKPGGVTSHDVVAAARRVFGTRRIGHAGTLDPMATGVLVLLLGEATKVAEIATGADKTYQARVCFGRATDSYDADGRTTAEAPVPPGALDAARINAALEAFPRSDPQLADAALMLGPTQLFLNAGFEVVHDFYPYPVLRRTLASAGTEP